MVVRFMHAAILLVLASPVVHAQDKPQTKPATPPVYPMPPPEPPIVTLPNGRGAPARAQTFTDKATRCLHYATSIGVPRDQIDDYVKRCVQQ